MLCIIPSSLLSVVFVKNAIVGNKSSIEDCGGKVLKCCNTSFETAEMFQLYYSI